VYLKKQASFKKGAVHMNRKDMRRKEQMEKKRIDLKIQALRKERRDIWRFLFSDEALEREKGCRKGDPFKEENQRIEDIEDELERLRKKSQSLYHSLTGYDTSKIELRPELYDDYCV
jgi:hypothetical protein